MLGSFTDWNWRHRCVAQSGATAAAASANVAIELDAPRIVTRGEMSPSHTSTADQRPTYAYCSSLITCAPSEYPAMARFAGLQFSFAKTAISALIVAGY